MNDLKTCPECKSIQTIFIQVKEWKIQGDICIICKNVFNIKSMEE